MKVGSVNKLLLAFSLTFASAAWSDEEVGAPRSTWQDFEKDLLKKSRRERIEGISYIAGGALTALGGFVGSFYTDDAAESLTYTVFQNVGIASIGMGYFKWRIGDEDRRFYRLLRDARFLSSQERDYLLARYNSLQEEARKNERVMRAIVHGLLAVTNLVAAAREDQSAVRNSLYFLGAMNVFATVSFSFDF